MKALQHHTTGNRPADNRSTDTSEIFQQEFRSLLSDIPVEIREEAQKFVRFTDTVLARMSSIASRLCEGFLQELRDSPESYDQLSAHHVELLAGSIGKESDVLHRHLRFTTMDVIGMCYEKPLRENVTETVPQR